MQRLYLQFYVTIVLVLVVFVGAAALLWRFAGDDATPQYLEVAAELTGALLPDADAPPAEVQKSLEILNRKLRFDLAMYRPDGGIIARVGRPPPRFDPNRARIGWRRSPAGPTFTLQLPDGRWLIARQVRERPPGPTFWIAAALALVAAAIAVGAYPVVRHLGRRLERLKAGVDELGGGNLSARVKVEGRDEVAALAASFNRSAQRIEELVAAHRLLLANCSHELRTPLARIGMAVSLLSDKADTRTRDSLKQDIAELDELIDQILLASRLDAQPDLERTEPVDLLAVAAEEAAHYDLEADGQSVTVEGDRALLRRLIRNLLENARRYAGDGPITVSVCAEDGRAVLEVSDRGPGVPPNERERIFEPFYRLATTRETGRGSGLGLALVRTIARRHGGDVVCLAADGKGSRFRVDLPTAYNAGRRHGS